MPGLGLLWGVVSAQTADAPARAPSADALQADVARGAAGLTRWLHALKTRASSMMVTAHRDDEDGGMLAMETRGMGARAVLLTLNRGEGGQNAMSPDNYDALGLVRTQELLAAGRYYGVDQYWTRAIDYGFSKTREEALEKWGHDRVLADVVRVIRMTRPLVITAVFVGAPTDGHGQHQLSGQVAQEAYAAAGDPTKFPEQIREGLRPWTPLKVYARVPFFDVTPKGMYDYATDKFVPVRFFDYVNQKWSDTKPGENLRIEEGSYAPVTGLTYLQIGREGLGLQKSQNGGMSIPPPGPLAAPYHRYGSRVPVAEHEESFFDGIEASVAGIGTLVPGEPDFLKRGLTDISKAADDAYNHYSAERPEDIAPTLAGGLHTTRSLIDQVRASNLADPGKSDVIFELCAKEYQFEQALTAALGLSMQATVAPDREPSGPFAAFRGAGPAFTIAIPGQSFSIQVRLVNESARELKIEGVELQAADGKPWQIAVNGETAKVVPAKRDAQIRFKVTAPADAALTRPYFTRPDEEQAYFDLAHERYRTL